LVSSPYRGEKGKHALWSYKKKKTPPLFRGKGEKGESSHSMEEENGLVGGALTQQKKGGKRQYQFMRRKKGEKREHSLPYALKRGESEPTNNLLPQGS